jgi:endonuclease YncB( thermonuclease family)
MRLLMRRFLTLFLLLLLCALWLFPEYFGLQGRESVTASGENVVVRDGDTLTIAKQDYRLHGIDAPEFSQVCKDAKDRDWLCGKLARAEMVSLTQGHQLTCEDQARDKYQRIVATCRDEKAVDIGEKMVDRGLAVSFGGFGEGPYAEQEADAKSAKRGLWQGQFEPPSSWRAKHPGHQMRQ